MPTLMHTSFVPQKIQEAILESLVKLSLQYEAEDKENEQYNHGLSETESSFMNTHCIDLIKAKWAEKPIKKEAEAPEIEEVPAEV